MSDSILLSQVDDASPSWLTGVLQAGGYLQSGEVIAVDIERDTSVNARNGRLSLTYSADAYGACPRQLFLKISNDDNPFGATEPQTYTTISPQITQSPFPHAFHVAYDKKTQHYQLLLDDLSETHQSSWHVTPNLKNGRLAVSALARLHAAWWDQPALPTIGDLPTDPVIDRYVAFPAQGVTAMMDETADDLSAADRHLIDSVFANHATRLKQRAAEGKNLTCVHGDPNPGNILSPLPDCGASRAYLIDRQLFDWSLSVWVGVSDLAYMMVHWWDPDLRRELERPLLQHYHQALLEFGVSDYGFDQLWFDYRLCAMQSFYVAAAWCVDPAERLDFEWVWQPQLLRTLEACHDLDCLALLD